MKIVPPPEGWLGLPADLPCLEVYRRPQRGPSCRLVACGDTGLTARLRARAGGYDACFAAVRPFLRAADLVFCNLEYTAKPMGKEVGKEASDLFAGLPEGVASLGEAGVNLASVANNHSYDYGPDGFSSSLAALAKAGITALGTRTNRDQPVTSDRQGLRIGWLACGRSNVRQDPERPGFWEYAPAELRAAVARHRGELDVLIVSIHTGYMYLDYPDPDLKIFAGQLSDEGADLILMHHAHVLQGVEVTARGRLVCYNLGNFLLDWTEGYVTFRAMARQQNESGLFCFDIDADGICAARVLPIAIEDRCRVVWAEGTSGRLILERLMRISDRLAGDFAPAFRRQRLTRNLTLSLKVVLTHLSRGRFRIAWRYIAERLRPPQRA